MGGLVGINYGRVSRCAASVSVTGNTYVGGLVGLDYYGTIDGCSATGSVSAAGSAADRVGGAASSEEGRAVTARPAARRREVSLVMGVVGTGLRKFARKRYCKHTPVRLIP